VFVCFVSSEHGSVKVVRFANLHLTRSQTWRHLFSRNFALLQTDSDPKSNKMTRRNLKGSRKLQTPLTFSGGVITGIANGGGIATGLGGVTNTDPAFAGISNANGSGNFNSSSGATGFIMTIFGGAQGTASGGGFGSQLGTAAADTGLGTVSFDGTTTVNGLGGFSGGISPVDFKEVITTIPGDPGVTGGSKKKGNTGATPDTTVSNFVPFLTGPTGGVGFGNGLIDITSGSLGTIMGATATGGTGTSLGSGFNFGGGAITANNAFGMAGGLASGAGTGDATGGGTTTLDALNGMFTGLGTSIGNFNNQGGGFFGAPTGAMTITFPSGP
jgi:hypothetical protein